MAWMNEPGELYVVTAEAVVVAVAAACGWWCMFSCVLLCFAVLCGTRPTVPTFASVFLGAIFMYVLMFF